MCRSDHGTVFGIFKIIRLRPTLWKAAFFYHETYDVASRPAQSDIKTRINKKMFESVLLKYHREVTQPIPTWPEHWCHDTS